MTAALMTDAVYYRPIPQVDAARSTGAFRLAGGWCWFTHVERLCRHTSSEIIPAQEVPEQVLERLTAPRPSLAGLDLQRPNLMGILNVTPDSFSDGGKFARPEAALEQVRHMLAHGVDIIDIGGESTRPGAHYVPVADEIARTAPVIRSIRTESPVPISIDTRKAPVAEAALEAGASLVNDVYAFTHDPDLAQVVVTQGAPVCLMHAQGDPEVMQENPQYDDVLLDVFDFLAERVAAAESAGIPRGHVLVDPGIGFGKTQAHNLALLNRLSLFHSLGCGVLLGASRKGFIGRIGKATEAQARAPGSMAVTLAGVAQGVQIHRVHDVAETRQALALWQAVTGGNNDT